MIKIDKIDHLVLTVSSIEATCNFYCQVLGMTRQEFGEGRVALKFGEHKINLHQAGNEFEPKARQALPGSVDLCLIASSSIDEIIGHLDACSIDIELGPLPRTGATGPLTSIYCRDPDGNLIEISVGGKTLPLQ
jgi:catechol 2,3-dioxygenase-like lactoylglutathione lyase family enzyme